MPGLPRTLRRALVGALAFLVVAWLCSAAGVLWYASRDQAASADAIVVMGAAQYLGRPSPVLRMRLDHAIALYARGLAPRIVVTGGTGEGDTTSEAAVSRAYLLRAKIPDSALVVETEGRSTRESVRAAARLLREHEVGRVIVVTDPFHVFRASLVARRQGFEALPSPTRTDDVWGRVVRQPTYFLAETVKVPTVLLFEW